MTYTQTMWTAEMKGSHKELHDNGMSATLIAVALNKQYGTAFTRNAIIGAAHRAGLAKRKSEKFSANWPCTRGSVERRKDNGGGAMYSIARRQVTGIKPLEKMKISKAPFLGIALLELGPDQCRFPAMEGPILFCGQPQKEDSSYCPHCHSIATRPWNASQ